MIYESWRAGVPLHSIPLVTIAANVLSHMCLNIFLLYGFWYCNYSNLMCTWVLLAKGLTKIPGNDFSLNVLLQLFSMFITSSCFYLELNLIILSMLWVWKWEGEFHQKITRLYSFFTYFSLCAVLVFIYLQCFVWFVFGIFNICDLGQQKQAYG